MALLARRRSLGSCASPQLCTGWGLRREKGAAGQLLADLAARGVVNPSDVAELQLVWEVRNRVVHPHNGHIRGDGAHDRNRGTCLPAVGDIARAIRGFEGVEKALLLSSAVALSLPATRRKTGNEFYFICSSIILTKLRHPFLTEWTLFPFGHHSTLPRPINSVPKSSSPRRISIDSELVLFRFVSSMEPGNITVTLVFFGLHVEAHPFSLRTDFSRYSPAKAGIMSGSLPDAVHEWALQSRCFLSDKTRKDNPVLKIGETRPIRC